VATHVRPTLPVLWGISGCTSTTCKAGSYFAGSVNAEGLDSGKVLRRNGRKARQFSRSGLWKSVLRFFGHAQVDEYASTTNEAHSVTIQAAAGGQLSSA
jgi:hypothetical protein